MGKPALGRGLGQLMTGQPSPGKAPAAAETEPSGKTIKVEFGRGLSTLVSSPPAQTPSQDAPKKVLLPAWFFFAADILLLTFAVAICFDASPRSDYGTFLFGIISVVFAALLGIAGVLRATE